MENELDVYEVLIYYETPTYQTFHIQGPSAEEALSMLKQQAVDETEDGHMMNFKIVSCNVIDPNPATHTQ